MTNIHLINTWKVAFGNAIPLGYLLRRQFHERWLRIHSLPESKRYPGSETEYAEMLHRHNTVATDLLGEGSPCLLIVMNAGDTPEWSNDEDTALLGATPEHMWEVEDVLEGEDRMQFFALEVTWRHSAFDPLLRAVADWKTIGLFANLASQSIYAPYDGGADLIFAMHAHVAPAKSKYTEWLSARKDGM